MSSELVVQEAPPELLGIDARLPALFLPDAKAAERFWEFFAANIRNRNTRRAYFRPLVDFEICFPCGQVFALPFPEV